MSGDYPNPECWLVTPPRHVVSQWDGGNVCFIPVLGMVDEQAEYFFVGNHTTNRDEMRKHRRCHRCQALTKGDGPLPSHCRDGQHPKDPTMATIWR